MAAALVKLKLKRVTLKERAFEKAYGHPHSRGTVP
jgi:hypothetical protein